MRVEQDENVKTRTIVVRSPGASYKMFEYKEYHNADLHLNGLKEVQTRDLPNPDKHDGTVVTVGLKAEGPSGTTDMTLYLSVADVESLAVSLNEYLIHNES